MSDKKIQQLEETIAHQDQLITDLNDVVTRLWDEIDMLKARLNKTVDKVRVIEETMPDPESEGLTVAEIAARDKPPHY